MGQKIKEKTGEFKRPVLEIQNRSVAVYAQARVRKIAAVAAHGPRRVFTAE